MGCKSCRVCIPDSRHHFCWKKIPYFHLTFCSHWSRTGRGIFQSWHCRYNLQNRLNLLIRHLLEQMQLKMNCVEISLYDVVKTTGEIKDTFKFTYKGRRYDRLSLSEKIRAGMEVSELMKRLTGRDYPVFVDNMESVDDLANVRPTGQLLMAKCVRNTDLSVRPMEQRSMPKAA